MNDYFYVKVDGNNYEEFLDLLAKHDFHWLSDQIANKPPKVFDIASLKHKEYGEDVVLQGIRIVNFENQRLGYVPLEIYNNQEKQDVLKKCKSLDDLKWLFEMGMDKTILIDKNTTEQSLARAIYNKFDETDTKTIYLYPCENCKDFTDQVTKDNHMFHIENEFCIVQSFDTSKDTNVYDFLAPNNESLGSMDIEAIVETVVQQLNEEKEVEGELCYE